MGVSKVRIEPDDVYNGKCKLIVQNRNFMTLEDVNECMSTLINKKCEGYDRIPVCVFLHAKNALLYPLAALFEKIYMHTTTTGFQNI